MADELEEEFEEDEQPAPPEDESVEEMVARLADEVEESDASLDSSPETEAEPPPGEPAPTDDRPRDEKGRFAKKVTEPETAPDRAAQTPTSRETEAPTAPEPEAPITVPASWAAEHRQAFARLPRELQQLVAERESQRDAFLLNTRRKWAAVEELVAPYEQHWAMQGISFPQVLQQYFAYSNALQENPLATGLQLMASHGVTREQLLSALTQGTNGSHHGQPSQNGMGYDPRLDQLFGEVTSLKQQLTAKQQYEAEQQKLRAATEVTQFFSQTDESGNLKYPFFAEAQPVMDAIAGQLRSLHPTMPTPQFLDLLYRKATAGDPRVEQYERSIAEQRRIAEASKRVEQSRKMGSSITGTPAGPMKKQVPDDIEAMVRAIANGEL